MSAYKQEKLISCAQHYARMLQELRIVQGSSKPGEPKERAVHRARRELHEAEYDLLEAARALGNDE